MFLIDKKGILRWARVWGDPSEMIEKLLAE